MFLNLFSRSFKRRKLTKSDGTKHRQKKYRLLLDCCAQVLGLSRLFVVKIGGGCIILKWLLHEEWNKLI